MESLDREEEVGWKKAWKKAVMSTLVRVRTRAASRSPVGRSYLASARREGAKKRGKLAVEKVELPRLNLGPVSRRPAG